MELRPADLGDAYQSALVLRRAHLPGAAQSVGGKISGTARRWTRRLGLTPDVERETLPVANRRVTPLQWTAGIWATAMAFIDITGQGGLTWHLVGAAAIAAGLYTFGEALPANLVRTLYTRSVVQAEIESLRNAAAATVEVNARKSKSAPTTLENLLPPNLRWLVAPHRTESIDAANLETDYFDLILATLRLKDADTEVETELRSALREIGGAVAAIRRSEVEEDRADARDLIGDAELLAARARNEPDRIVAASLLRQAQARVEQAKLVEKNAVLRRRTRALSAELRAQIAAAQSSLRNLSSQGAMRAESSGAFRAIGRSVSTLAVEADSVMRAHEELSAALGESNVQAATVTPTTKPAENTIGRAASPAVRPSNDEETIVINRRRG